MKGLEGLAYVSILSRMGLYSICGRLLRESRVNLMKILKIFNAEVDVGLAAIIELSSHTAMRAP